MKLIARLVACFCCLLMVSFVAGCLTNPDPSGDRATGQTEPQFLFQGTVTYDQVPSTAEMLFVWGDRDSLLTTASDGSISLACQKPPDFIVAVRRGASSRYDGPFTVGQPVRIELADGPTHEVATAKTMSEYWFGVYSTDGNGDVKFRYRYTFNRFVCTSWMPNLGYGGSNPNGWTSQNVSFPSPWLGKKLLVPTRYRWWHAVYYGFSISNALYLVSVL